MAETEENPEPVAKKVKVEREFDFKKYGKRHVLLMISYLGWDYCGLVRQVEVENTVEAALHAALIKTKLIPSIETANYRRCGRTDKGVSAFRQVVSLDVRTLVGEGEGVFIPEGHVPCVNTNHKYELNYLEMLNRVLPSDIRVLAWAPVPVATCARYDCRQRTYKYFFAKADLDIDVMRSAGQLLIGKHDFRNFCKFDLSKNRIKTTVREISAVTIELADQNSTGTNSFDMYVLTISAPSFLWHQIRNIVSVLIHVGQGNEQPNIVTKLLDVEVCPRKPQYAQASEIPLILYNCQFDNVKWQWDQLARKLVLIQMQRQWTELATKAQMLKSMCEDLAREAIEADSTFTPVREQGNALLPDYRRKKYVSLLRRPTGPSMEQMQAKCDARKAKKEQEESKDQSSDLSDSGG